MNKTVKSILNIFISVVVLALCVIYAMKDVDISQLWEIIKSANYVWVLAPVPVILASHWVRAMRWRRILKPFIKAKSVLNLFSSVMVGYAINCISPRGGEFVRPFTFARREKVSYSSVLGTIVVERFIDVVALALMLAATFFFQSDKLILALPAQIDTNKMIFMGVLVLAVLVLGFYPPACRFLLKALLKPISAKFYDKIMELFEKFVVGFSIIKKPREYFMLIIESVTIWLLYTLPMYLMFFSFDFEATLHLGFADAIMLCVVSGVITTIAPTPGALGLYHLAIQSAMLTIYGIPADVGLAYATLTHGVNYLVQIAVGGAFFFRENVSMKNIPETAEEN